MYQALATGNADAMTTAWLPITHADYMKKVGDKVVDLGPNLHGPAVLGWVVPSYVTIDSIPDMKDEAVAKKNSTTRLSASIRGPGSCAIPKRRSKPTICQTSMN